MLRFVWTSETLDVISPPHQLGDVGVAVNFLFIILFVVFLEL